MSALKGQPEVSQSVVGRLYSARASRKNGSDSLDEEEIIKDVGAVAFIGRHASNIIAPVRALRLLA